MHPHLHDFVNYHRDGDIISLPLYHGCNRVNRNGTRKETRYNLGYQRVVPTDKHYWRETEDKYKRKINDKFYWIRYMTRTNRRHLFKNKSNFVYNHKLKKYEHMSKTPMRVGFKFLQPIRKDLFKHALRQKRFYFLLSCKR